MNYDKTTSNKPSRIIGQIEVFEDYPGRGTVLSVITDAGDEFVIINKKAVKKLMKYAGEEVSVEIDGVIDFDHSLGMNILNVTSIKDSDEINAEEVRRKEKLLFADQPSKKKRRYESVAEEELAQDDLLMILEVFDDVIKHEDDELANLPFLDDDDELALELIAQELELGDDLDLDLLDELGELDELDALGAQDDIP